MTEQNARELLMEYLYDEISAADEKRLENYLSDHPEMQQELDELRKTRALLGQAPEVEPDRELQIVGTAHSANRDWTQNVRALIPRSGWGKTALATAACLVLILVSAAIVDLNIESTQAGVSVYFGKRTAPQKTGLTEAQTEAIVEQIRSENAAVLTEYADMLNKHNKQQLQQIVQHFERQRLNDLQLVEQALSQYQQKTKTQIQQTNQVLGEVIQTMAANN